ncbi:MAG TPA: PilZ domain-containing protein [Solirubrobacter sp.]|nr:PilZ domain-containing protein [Solirubrobacter sp.]
MDQRLFENANVTISLPFSGAPLRVSDFEATVVALVRSAIVLEPVSVNADLVPAHAEDVYLSFESEHRLVGLKGELIRDRRGVRFQAQDGVRARTRGYTRVDVDLPITLRHATDTCHGVTINVAPEGLLVRADLSTALDDVLEISLKLPRQDRPLALDGRVVRHGSGLIALNFVGSHDAVAAIAEFVVERRYDEVRDAALAAGTAACAR